MVEPVRTPFIVGRVVPPDKFINRQREICDAVSLLLTGQSLAITGEPRSGKSSLLHYLKECRDLYGVGSDRLVFFYADVQSWPDALTRQGFWERAFEPLVQAIRQQTPDSSLLETYAACQREKFGTFGLERFLAQLQEAGWHLVLLLDEFDVLLHHPVLNSTEFYGGLRSLASRYGPALTLVIGSRRSLSELNEATQKYTRTGSPFFNFVNEIPLRPFEREEALKVLDQADPPFEEAEREQVLTLAGGHPYLLQIAGDALWQARMGGLSRIQRWRSVGEELLRAADAGLREIWQGWTPRMRWAFAIIALDEAPLLLGQREFDLEALRPWVEEGCREVRRLREKGFITEDAQSPSGYRVTAKVMLWWLAEELLAALHSSDDDVDRILAREEWLGLLKRGEVEAMVNAVQGLGKIVTEGAQGFIKAMAEGFGKAIAKP